MKPHVQTEYLHEEDLDRPNLFDILRKLHSGPKIPPSDVCFSCLNKFETSYKQKMKDYAKNHGLEEPSDLRKCVNCLQVEKKEPYRNCS